MAHTDNQAAGGTADRHERHADAVADLVVQGKSSEALLSEYAGRRAPTENGNDRPREADVDARLPAGRITRPGPAYVPPVVQLHAADKVLKFTAKWLARRPQKLLTKHIARHARRISGRAVHSVFRQPRKVRQMIQGAVRDATALAARNATRPATEVLEEGAIRLARQATGTPGKFRWVVQKTFAHAIGTQGERILRIIIDQSGRIVTAFPADRLIAIGLGVSAVEILGERSVAAAERAREYAAIDAAREDDVSWWEFVPIIGDVWGGSLNEGESEGLARARELEEEIVSLITAIEEEEKVCLGPEERTIVRDTFLAAVGTPLLVESEEEMGP